MNQFVDEAADALVVEALGRAVAAGVRGALWAPPCADFLRRDNLPDRSGDAWLVLAARPGYKSHPHGGGCKTRYVIDLLRFVSGLAADLVRRRVELVAENALLRQQLIAAVRKIAGRVRWTPSQRFMIVLAARLAPAWREARRSGTSESSAPRR
jgi:hypothetical protein